MAASTITSSPFLIPPIDLPSFHLDGGLAHLKEYQNIKSIILKNGVDLRYLLDTIASAPAPPLASRWIRMREADNPYYFRFPCVIRKNSSAHWHVNNTWIEWYGEGKYEDGRSRYIQDTSTKDIYINDDATTIYSKLWLAGTFGWLGQLFFSAGLFICHLVAGIVYACVGDVASAQEHLSEIPADIARLIALPFVLIFYLALIFLVSQYEITERDARKLFATMERTLFGKYVIIAPCFQPYPVFHFFKGQMGDQNAY